MHQCCVFGCRNEGGHSFPKDVNVRKLWEAATRRKDFRAKKYSKMCSAHFKPEDYIKIGKFTGLENIRRILKKGSVPSIFPSIGGMEDIKSRQRRERAEKMPLTALERYQKIEREIERQNPQKFEEMKKQNAEQSKAKKRKTEDIFEVKNKEVNMQHSLNKETETSIIERLKKQIFHDIERPIVMECLEKRFNDDDDCNNDRPCAEGGLEEQPRCSNNDKDVDNDYKIMILIEESHSDDDDDYRKSVRRAKILGEQPSNNDGDDDYRPDVTDRLADKHSSDDNNDSEDDRSSVTVSVEGQPFFYDDDDNDGPSEVQFHDDVEENDSLVPDTTPLSWQKCKSIPIQTGSDDGMEAGRSHQGFKCSQCSGDIVGFRYTCVQCADYDLCAACEARRAHAHHYVLRVPGSRPYAEIQDVVARIRAELFRGLQLQTPGLPTLASVKTEVKDEEESDPLRDIYEEDYAIANYHAEITSEVKQTSRSHIKTSITTLKEDIVSNASLLRNIKRTWTPNFKAAIITSTKDTVLLRNNKLTSTPNIKTAITTSKEDIVSNTSLLKNNNQPCKPNIKTEITTSKKDIVLLRNNKLTSTPNINTAITTSKKDIVLLRNNKLTSTPNIKKAITTSRKEIVLLRNNKLRITPNTKAGITISKKDIVLFRNNKLISTPNYHIEGGHCAKYIITKKQPAICT